MLRARVERNDLIESRQSTTEAMADAAYAAWRADILSGKSTVLISDSNEAVAALHVRARTELILEGRVDALREVTLHDGTRAAVGDTVITRRNDRRLYASHSWVRNGDRWNVIRVHRNGSLEVRRQSGRRRNTVLLPASYVSQHVERGYAVTSHRAQGITTDTAHVVVAPSMPRENLYVAMTRGREANTAYVAVDRPDVAHVGPRPGDDTDVTARNILCGIFAARRRRAVSARDSGGRAGCVGIGRTTRGGRATRPVGFSRARERTVAFAGFRCCQLRCLRPVDRRAAAR
ncbi:hypothetical protein [Cryobacterium sp. Y50]|uniref:hypothetical protein n=1 Tax=Cryobacterium sp. Y50 TaxID=2048286 RepID=UPI0011B04A2D|nr:hypothetical protein [Cryobacterium sp. Y50]